MLTPEFTVYLKDSHEIVPVRRMNFHDETITVEIYDKEVGEHIWFDQQDIILLPFTGLVDQYDTKLYHDDVVARNNSVSPKIEFYRVQLKPSGLVFVDEYGVPFPYDLATQFEDTHNGTGTCRGDYWTKIGNIHLDKNLFPTH